MTRTGLTLAAALLSASLPASAAELIVNGDFSAAGPEDVPGWTVDPGGEIVVTSGSSYGGPSTDRIVSFGGGQLTNVSTLNQTVSTVLGTSYQLTFRYGSFGGQGNTLTARILDSSNAVIASGTYFNGSTFNYGNIFAPYALSFTGPGGATTVQFFVDEYSHNTDGLLDDVSLLGPDLAPGVPEPSTWALLILGFGVVGVAARRRKKLAFAS